jgi:signal peptidase I
VDRRLRRIVLVVAFLAAIVLTRTLVLQPQTVVSTSMQPTISKGDVVLANRLGPVLGGVGQGDLVTFETPTTGELMVKRVVAMPGQTVAIEDAELVIDGEKVDEPYVDRTRLDAIYYGPVTVPEGHVLVLGDNRLESIDSRDYGPIPLDTIQANVVVTLPLHSGQ